MLAWDRGTTQARNLTATCTRNRTATCTRNLTATCTRRTVARVYRVCLTNVISLKQRGLKPRVKLELDPRPGTSFSTRQHPSNCQLTLKAVVYLGFVHFLRLP